METVFWSRLQFAMTAAYHWLFVPLTLGLARDGQAEDHPSRRGRRPE